MACADADESDPGPGAALDDAGGAGAWERAASALFGVAAFEEPLLAGGTGDWFLVPGCLTRVRCIP